MRLRLVLAGLLAVASFSGSAGADPLHFERECSAKVVDSACYHDFCGIYDCTRSDCLVYSGVFGAGNAAFCFGKARPRGPVS